MRPLLALLTVTASTQLVGSAAARDWVETSIDKVSGVYETSFTLQAGETYDFWTSDLISQSSCSGASPDPVMHLWQTYPSTGHVASNDDCDVSGLTTGLNSCIRYTAPSSLPPLGVMVVTVIVHGYSTCSDSQGRLHASGSNINDPNALGRFGGMHLDSIDPYWGLSWLQNDTVQIVRSPDSISPAASFRAYATKTERNGSCLSNDIRLIARSSSGIAGGATMVMPSASSGSCSGGAPIRYRLIVGSSTSSDANRKGRVYINDKLITDTDGDGLGNLLEDAVGTCRQVGGPNFCTYAGSIPKDTDRDGLEDAAELLGVSSGSLRLPAWGANPRHKDVFVELDWGPGVTAFMGSSTAQAVASNFVGGTATHAGNPDGQPGFAAHFDVDLTPSSCASSGTGCSTIYGDWGGSSTVTTSDYLASGDNDMATARRGIFFHGLVLPGGNAASTNWKFRVGRGSGETPFKRNTTHGLGLAMGATRWGNDSINPDDAYAVPRLDCKPSYPSIMNYGYANLTPSTFSTGAVTTTINSTALNEQTNPGLDPAKLAAGFGLTATSTTIDWNRSGASESGTTRAVTRWATGGVRDCNVSDIHPAIEDLDLHQFHAPGVVDIATRPTAQASEVTVVQFAYVTSAGQLLLRSADRSLLCTSPGTPSGCCEVDDNQPCLNNLGAPTTIATGVTSSPAVAVEEPISVFAGNQQFGDPRLMVVYMKGSGAQRDAFARSVGLADLTSETELDLPVFQSGTDRRGDGSLVQVVDHGESAANNYFYYLGPTGELRRARLARSLDIPPMHVQSDEQLFYNGQAVTSVAAPSATVNDGLPFIVIVNSSGALELYREDGDVTNTLTRFPTVFASQSSPVDAGRPSFMFHGAMRGNAWHVVYASNSNLFGAWSYGNWFSTPSPFVADGRMYSHEVTGILGVGLARLVPKEDELTDVQRLEMVSSCPSCAPGAFDPVPLKYAAFASGVFAFGENDSNDFVTFRSKLCVRLRADTSCSTACGNCDTGLQDVESLLP